MARKKKSYTAIVSFFALIVGVIIGFIGSIYIKTPDSFTIPASVSSITNTASAGAINADTVKDNDLSIHFLELGNKYTALM